MAEYTVIDLGNNEPEFPLSFVSPNTPEDRKPFARVVNMMGEIQEIRGGDFVTIPLSKFGYIDLHDYQEELLNDTLEKYPETTWQHDFIVPATNEKIGIAVLVNRKPSYLVSREK